MKKLTEVHLDLIDPNPEQPRRVFDEDALTELSASLRQHGLLQPVEVVKEGGRYVLNHGERRVRAARLAGWEKITAVVLINENATGDRRERALVENLVREDMTPIEEGEAYQKMIDAGVSRQAIARRLNISLARVAKCLDLLELEPGIQAMVAAGRLPSDHRVTRALLSIDDSAARVTLAGKVAESGLTIKGMLKAVETYHNLTGTQRKVVKTYSTAPGQPKRSYATHLVYGDTKAAPETEKAALASCKRCGMFTEPMSPICNECPLTVFLQEQNVR
jgi:ParB family transcriptional regulator, chromosome partitioning protein